MRVSIQIYEKIQFSARCGRKCIAPSLFACKTSKEQHAFSVHGKTQPKKSRFKGLNLLIVYQYIEERENSVRTSAQSLRKKYNRIKQKIF